MLQMFVLALSLYNTIEFKVSFFYAKSRTCSFIVSYLRKKLTALHANIQIKATRNVGYSLEEVK